MKIPRGRRALLVLGLPVGLAAAGALAFLQLSSGGAAGVVTIPDPGPGQHGAMLALESRVINLQPSTASPTYRYAKVAITVELRPADAGFYALQGEARATAEKTLLTEHEDGVPLLLDALGQVVSAHDAPSLISADGRAKLKTELLSAMRRVLGDEEVLDVYFTDFVMQ